MIKRLLGFLIAAAGLVALLPAAIASDLEKAAVHQVTVSFTPRTITLGESAIFTVVLKNPQGGGNRTGVSWILALPTGLTTPGVNINSDCSASGRTFNAIPSITVVLFSGLTLPPGGTCTVHVTVVPREAGTFAYAANALVVNSNSGSNSNAAGATLIVNPAPLPVGEVSASSLVFASQAIGTSSESRTVSVSNIGGGVLGITSISVEGDFAVSGCASASLAAGGSCSLAISFKPASTGARLGFVDVRTSASTSAYRIALSGTGTAPAVALAPSSVSFGSVHVGATASSSVRLSNPGNAPLVVSAIGVTGGFFTQSNSCATLEPLASCLITVTYSPTSIGTHAGQLSVNSNALGGPVSISLSGSATPAPAPVAVLTPSSLAFGSAFVGESPRSSLTLSNAGTAPLTVTQIATSGAFFAHSHGCPPTLLAGESCPITVSYSPTATGSHSGQLSVQSNAAASPALAGLSGSAAPAPAPALALSRASVDFGSQTVGSSSTGQSVVLSNRGTAALNVTSISVSGEFSASGCVAPSSIPAGGSCTLSIVFQPTGLGSRPAGSVQIFTNAPNSPHSIALSGSGTAPGVSLSPSPLSFGSVTVNSSTSLSVTLSNTGSASLDSIAISIAGAFFAKSTLCSVSLAPQGSPGSSCTITVTYAPTGEGSHSGQLTVQSNAGTHLVSLSGNATPPPMPVASLSRGSVAFGTQPVGGGSAAQPVTLSNTGNAAMNVTAISAAGDFSFSGCVAGSSIPAGGSCTLSILFTPSATGDRSGSIQISTNAPGAPLVIALSGTGTAPGAVLTPAAVTFGSVVVGASATSSVTLSNNGTAPLAISSIETTGTALSQAHACPPSLAPSASCVISITFAPSAIGSHSGQLRVLSNASGSPAVASLAGTAAPAPAPALAIAPAAIGFGNVALGANASASATLSNTGNAPLNLNSITAGGDFIYSGCAAPATIPSGGSCTLNVTFTPAAAGARSGAIQIATNAPGAPHAIALSGTGTTIPGIALGPESLDYGTIVAKSSVLLRVTIRSTGTGPLGISSITLEGLAFAQTSTCGVSLPPGATCDIWVEFSPTATGTHTGRLIVNTDAGTGPSVVLLAGTAVPPPPPRLQLSRASIDFGSQTLGVMSGPQLATVANAGATPVDIASIAITGDFGFEGCATPVTLVADETCDLSVKFLPTSVGARSGSIMISSNATDAPHAIMLAGAGTPAPVPGIAVAPTAVAFGAVNAGSSVVMHLALTNTGNAALGISSITTTAAVFTQTNTCPLSLAPSAACSISVTYAPAAAGSHSGELRVASSAVPNPLIVPLSGSALPAPAPVLRLSSTSVVFGAQFVGVTSGPRAVSLTNVGTAPLRISSITSTGDFGYSGCGYPATIAAGDSCVFSITFKPLTVGELTGAIEVTSDAPGSPHTISLAGRGASFAVPEISLAPSHLAFGPVTMGSTTTQRMRLTNAGASALQISSIRASGSFFAQSNDCAATIAVASGCDIAVTYSPASGGAHSGHVAIESNAVPSPHVVPLSGSGLPVPPPFLAVERSVDFGQQVTGTTAREGLRLSNTGGAPLVITAARILGSPEFGVGPGCASIAPAASCVLELTFTPTALREFAARLDIVSNHSGGVVQVDLSGVGVPKALPDLELSVAGLGWGNQTVGTLGEERIVKLTSIGGEALRINAITASPDFVVNAGQCPALLDPKRSCEVRVTFKPLVPGPRQGRLTIDSNATGEPDSVSLTGVGCRLFAMGAARNPSRLCAP